MIIVAYNNWKIKAFHKVFELYNYDIAKYSSYET